MLHLLDLDVFNSEPITTSRENGVLPQAIMNKTQTEEQFKRSFDLWYGEGMYETVKSLNNLS